MNFKLNLKKKPGVGNLKQPKGIGKPVVQKRTLFQVENSDDEEDEQYSGLETKKNQEKLKEETKYETEKERDCQKRIRLQQREEESKRITEHSRILLRKYAKEAEEQQKANPEAFQYDEIYDDIKKNKERKERKSGNGEKSTYIGGLLALKTERERRNNEAKELRIQRQLREEEELFGKKETFVTGTYRKQLEKDAKEKAKQKSKDAEEEEQQQRKIQESRKKGGFTRTGAGMKNVYLRFLDDGEREEEEDEVETLSNGSNADIRASSTNALESSRIPFFASASRSSDDKDSNGGGDASYAKFTNRLLAVSDYSESDSDNDIKGAYDLDAGLNLTAIAAGLSPASTTTSQHIDNTGKSIMGNQKLTYISNRLNESEKKRLRELATRLFRTTILESEINQAKARYYKRKKQRQRDDTVF